MQADSGGLEVDWPALRNSLGARFATTEELAQGLHAHIETALAQADRTPLGPVSSVDGQIKRLIRAYVQEEAFRTTETWRCRQAAGEVSPTGRSLRPHIKAAFTNETTIRP